MRYNKTLDLLVCALMDLRQGKPNSAALHLSAAAHAPDVKATVMAIEKANARAFKAANTKPVAKTSKVSASTRVRAEAECEDMEEDDTVEAGDAEWPFEAGVFDGVDDSSGIPKDEPGEDLRIEPEVNGDRTIQSGDDMDELDADEIFASDEDEEMPEDDGEGEVEMDEQAAYKAKTLSANARLARTLANLTAAAKKKKKPASKKK